MRRIYNYAAVTGELLDPLVITYAQLSPNEVGVYLMPARSTDIAPPTMLSTERCYFSAGAWVKVTDYRGELWFSTIDGSSVEITTLNLTGLNLVQTRAELPVAIVKSYQLELLITTYTTHVTAGFTSSALGSVHTYASTYQDQSNLVASVASNITVDYNCTNAAGVKADRTHTHGQLLVVLQDGIALLQSYRTHLQTLVDQIQDPLVTSSAAVLAITW